jgi:hypothetical protein
MLWQLTAHRVFTVVLKMYLTDHFTPATGKTLSVLASKAGGVASLISGTSAEIPSVSGLYKIDLAVADTDTVGALALHVTASGCDELTIPCQVIAQPDFTVGSVNDASPGTDRFKTTLTETTPDYWRDCDLVVLTGTLTQQRKRVSRYVIDGSDHWIYVSSSFTGAPVNGDKFCLVNH